MRTHGRWLFLVVFLLLSVSAGAQSFVASLSGANEVPPADPDGSGTASITIIGTTVHYSITIANITPPTMQHIHSGAAGVNGPIVVNLPGTFVGNILVGSTTSDAATINAIIANPSAFYVNVHTNDFPGGAIRGQLAATVTTVPTMSAGMLVLLSVTLAAGALLVLRKIA